MIHYSMYNRPFIGRFLSNRCDKLGIEEELKFLVRPSCQCIVTSSTDTPFPLCSVDPASDTLMALWTSYNYSAFVS